MIRLRLQRKGRKKRPYYHIVVADKRSPRDGRVIERVGRFDNVSENMELTLDEERIIHWLTVGAQPSDTVRNILKHEGILYKMHLIRWGKSDEEIEAAIAEWRKERESKKDVKFSRKEQQKALLDAEEKEYKKQLEEKASKAAKELKKAKEEADAPVEAASEDAVQASETEDVAAADSETSDEAVSDVAEEEQADTTAEAEDVSVQETDEEKEEAVKAEEEETTSEEGEQKEAEAVNSEEEDAEEEEEKAELTESEEPPATDAEETEGSAKAESLDQKSTDMNANEAIEVIKNTPLDQLEGFIPEDEERVTVLRALESKQSE